MPNFVSGLWKEYLETRTNAGEDFLYWLLQRKMTWGQRWLVVLVLTFMVQPSLCSVHPLSDWHNLVCDLCFW
ncbi:MULTISPECIES: hypothetical protein [Streptococcus]|uniref:hypothetical protein n=1 Tax=Streptococcus TaxID=1301 RepID=UPI001EDFAB9B|nr:hypothetical protein [Streptococcus suis]